MFLQSGSSAQGRNVTVVLDAALPAILGQRSEILGAARRHRLTVSRARYNVQVPTALPVHANVAFLRIAQFDTRPVAEQAMLKEKLEARAKAATAGIPEADRIVLDAAD